MSFLIGYSLGYFAWLRNIGRESAEKRLTHVLMPLKSLATEVEEKISMMGSRISPRVSGYGADEVLSLKRQLKSSDVFESMRIRQPNLHQIASRFFRDVMSLYPFEGAMDYEISQMANAIVGEFSVLRGMGGSELEKHGLKWHNLVDIVEGTLSFSMTTGDSVNQMADRVLVFLKGESFMINSEESVARSLKWTIMELYQELNKKVSPAKYRTSRTEALKSSRDLLKTLTEQIEKDAKYVHR